MDLKVIPRVSVTAIVDNFSGYGHVMGEWGLSLLLDTGAFRLLLDTGGGRALIGNARALELDLRTVDAIVLSHEHQDHTAGLKAALRACGRVDLYAHPAGFETRYWKDDELAEPHSLPLSRRQLRWRVRRLVETREPTMIGDGLYVTGQVPRLNGFEDTGVGRHAFLDEGATMPDLVLDDQSIFFRVPEGLVIVLGCAHSGLVNTMDYVSLLTGESRIHALMGGTHLVAASPTRLANTVQALRKYDVRKIRLSHCTGVDAYAAIASAFPGRCSWPAAGTKVTFGQE